MNFTSTAKDGSTHVPNICCKYTQINEYTRISIYHPRYSDIKKAIALNYPEENLEYFTEKLNRCISRRLLDKGEIEREKTFISFSTPSKINSTKRRIAELCLLNRPQYFGTLTFSDDTIFRYGGSIDDMIKDLKRKLHDYEKYHKGFRLMYVFELGEQHGRIHLHFIGDIPQELIRINENGYPEIGYFRERFGFMQMSKINNTDEDYKKVSGYITKYITKSCLKIGNRFLHKVGKFDKPISHYLKFRIIYPILNQLFKLKRRLKNGFEVPIIRNYRYCITGWGFFRITDILSKYLPFWRQVQSNSKFSFEVLPSDTPCPFPRT